MKVKFQADADLDGRILRGLRRANREIDMLTSAAAGLAGLDDLSVLRIASESGRILVSQDRGTMPRHFHRFVQTNESAGVLIVREATPISAAIDDLALIWSVTEASEWINRLVWIPL